MFQKQRVVVTGMGVITPLGNQLNVYWENLCAGKSGIRRIQSFDPSEFRSQIAGEIDFDASQWFTPHEINRADRYAQMAQAAGIEAMKDAQLDPEQIVLDRAGVFVGTSIGGIAEIELQAQQLLTKGPKRVSPFLISKMMTNAIAGDLSIRFGFHGSNYTASSACASSAHAIGQAFHAIRSGALDIVLTGGSEAAITPLSIAGFCAVKALSKRNEDPTRASRPFDRERDGFVMGEGSGILLLESLEHAKKRKARIYAEIFGVGFTADAYHITDPHPEGKYAALAMEQALHEGGISKEAISYINAHGTSTHKNDLMETNAIKKVFGVQAHALKINSTKSMIGHLLGAAGAVEMVDTILTLTHQQIHLTLNYTVPDPECDLDYCPRTQKHPVRYALSNSFGFGGHNVSLLVGQYQE
ncbi:MAG: beta-ketoacyl-ACP synthase II [Planctomycetota bacterium]